MFQTSLQRVDDGRLQQTTGICEDIHLHPVYRLVRVKIEFTIRQIYDASQSWTGSVQQPLKTA
jgi:hypothetical protein